MDESRTPVTGPWPRVSTGATSGSPSIGAQRRTSESLDMGPVERILSAAGGGALALIGLRRGGVGGTALAAAGAYLLYRGGSGQRELHRRARFDQGGARATPEHPGRPGTESLLGPIEGQGPEPSPTTLAEELARATTTPIDPIDRASTNESDRLHGLSPAERVRT